MAGCSVCSGMGMVVPDFGGSAVLAVAPIGGSETRMGVDHQPFGFNLQSRQKSAATRCSRPGFPVVQIAKVRRNYRAIALAKAMATFCSPPSRQGGFGLRDGQLISIAGPAPCATGPYSR